MEDNDAATASSSNSSSEITQYINIENAKLVALVIVLGFVGYHGVLHLKYGKTSLFLRNGRRDHLLNGSAMSSAARV